VVIGTKVFYKKAETLAYTNCVSSFGGKELPSAVKKSSEGESS
jgi:hypothetical protein